MGEKLHFLLKYEDMIILNNNQLSTDEESLSQNPPQFLEIVCKIEQVNHIYDNFVTTKEY